MRTDDLVTMLSANVEPVGGGLVGRAISIAVAAGAAVALGIMLVALGVRADLTTTRAIVFLGIEACFRDYGGWRVGALSHKARPSRRGRRNFAARNCGAVCSYRAIRRNQPGWRAKRALEPDDPWR